MEDMSREELIELVTANNAGGVESPAPSTRKVEVNGIELEVYEEMTKTWPVFKLLGKIKGELDIETINAMMSVIEQVTNIDEDTIVEHCGGKNASIQDVVGTASKIIAECFPKK